MPAIWHAGDPADGTGAAGAAEARRVDRTGARGDDACCTSRGSRDCAKRAAICSGCDRRCSWCPRPQASRGCATRSRAAAGADGRRRSAPADRVHQCREPGAGARRGAAARDGGARVARRRPAPPGASGADRIAPAVRGGRPARRRARRISARTRWCASCTSGRRIPRMAAALRDSSSRPTCACCCSRPASRWRPASCSDWRPPGARSRRPDIVAARNRRRR